MQASAPVEMSQHGRFGRNLSYFLVAPLTTLVALSLVFAFAVTNYQSQHNGRIYTGITVWGVDLSGKTPEEAQAALSAVFPYPQEQAITFTDPATNQTWTKSPAELGITIDATATVNTAMTIGRTGSPWAQFQEMFQTWYYGRSLAPTIIFDQAKLDVILNELSTTINQPATNATIAYDGSSAEYSVAKPGRLLDLANTRDRLLSPLTDFRHAQIELLVHDVQPTVYDDVATADEIAQTISSPITFYVAETLDDLDLQPVTLPQEELVSWLRVDVTTAADGTMQHSVSADEDAARYWISQLADEVYREPIRARFYFDDATRELVLVAPHINGRELDVEATLANFLTQVNTPNRSVQMVVKDILPDVTSDSTAADLGITELVSEKVTWFYGSSDARKHNIARAAANFYGIVVAPGEEFSFLKYLGSISSTDGYEEGLIIVGGQTIKGVGGGICQVSTTIYQTAFWAGFPMTARLEHGYWLDYYNDGEGPGMDATVYSPIVDLKFINNTPYYLLMENYYSTENEALTFKFYSTSLGRTIVKEGPFFENETEVPGSDQDRWVYDPNLPAGTVQQIDWATQGADVTVYRTVLNANGEEILPRQAFTSHYIPYPNTYHYGPGVEPYDYSKVPEVERP